MVSDASSMRIMEMTIAVTIIGMLLVMPTAVITESKEKIKSIKVICRIAVMMVFPTLNLFSIFGEGEAEVRSLKISNPLLTIKNSPPQISKRSLKENPISRR